MRKRAPVTVIILTYNSEQDIRLCLESVADLADEIFIVDSFSTDHTLEIARLFTSNIYQHQFENFAKQRMWGLENLPIRNEWILHLDADERFMPELSMEVCQVIDNNGNGIDAYYIKRRFYFLGKWLRYGSNYPMPEIRLFRKHLIRVIDACPREYVAVRGKVGTLRHDMIHENNRGLSAWVTKANMLAEWDAVELITSQGAIRLNSASTDEYVELRRSRWLRQAVWNKLPMFVRPFFLFIVRYVFQLGFLDGAPGLVYAVLKHFWYPFLISAQYYEKCRVTKENLVYPSSPDLPE